MAKPFDASGKDLITEYPADWLAFLGGPAVPIEVIVFGRSPYLLTAGCRAARLSAMSASRSF